MARFPFRIFRRILISASLLAMFLALCPGFVYVYGLATLPTFPSVPLERPVDSTGAWVNHSGAGLPYAVGGQPSRTMDTLNPWSYACHVLWRCKKRSGGSRDIHECVYYFNGWIAAYSASNYHLFPSGIEGLQTVSESFQVLSLGIWITRHWSPEQVEAFLATRPR